MYIDAGEDISIEMQKKGLWVSEELVVYRCG